MRPDYSKVDVPIGPQPPPPRASTVPVIRPKGARTPRGTGLTFTTRLARLKAKRAKKILAEPEEDDRDHRFCGLSRERGQQHCADISADAARNAHP
jgi:hypothetical protein